MNPNFQTPLKKKKKKKGNKSYGTVLETSEFQ
jgi:hypothetical protein